MNWITHRLNNDPDIAGRVRQRHWQAINQLEKLGFQPLCTYAEDVIPFSLLLLTPIYWMMSLNKEVVRIGDWLRIVTYYPLMISYDHGVIVLINSLGVKFYSALSNDSVLITANTSARSVIQDARSGIYKQSQPGDAQNTWEIHLETLERWEAFGVPRQRLNSFEEYVTISEREERRGWMGIFNVAGTWMFIILMPVLVLLNYLRRLPGALLYAPEEWVVIPLDMFKWLKVVALLASLLVLVLLAIRLREWRTVRTTQDRSVFIVATILIVGFGCAAAALLSLVLWLILGI